MINHPLSRISLPASIALLGACLLWSSCSRSSSDDQPKSTQATTEPGREQPSPGNPAAQGMAKAGAPPIAPIAEAEVRALLDRWLDVQNQGDFPAYESLYAKRFEGVRRSGSKVVRLDRKGWMVDRGGMFKRKMEVELSDIEIDVFSQSAILTFTQRWASGSYQDIGPKQLVAVREDSALRIAREEMLSSTLIEAQSATSLANDDLVFLIQEGGVTYAVLAEVGDVPTGARTLISRGQPVVVAAEVSASELPPEVARWRGRQVVHGDCTMTVDAILALSRVEPHFSERQVWDGMDGDNQPFTDQQIADAAFHPSAAHLVGKLRRDGGACGSQRYAFAAGRPGPTIQQRAVDPALAAAVTQAALTAFRGLASYKDVQKDFASYGYQGAWEEYPEGGRGAQVTISAHPDKQSLQVVVMAKSGHGCGDFEGRLTAHFVATGSAAKPKLERVYESPHHTEIVDVLDVDRDGVFEYLTQGFTDTSLVSFSGDTLRTISVGFFDCGC